jgi:hypothetical protein
MNNMAFKVFKPKPREQKTLSDSYKSPVKKEEPQENDSYMADLKREEQELKSEKAP